MRTIKLFFGMTSFKYDNQTDFTTLLEFNTPVREGRVTVGKFSAVIIVFGEPRYYLLWGICEILPFVCRNTLNLFYHISNIIHIDSIGNIIRIFVCKFQDMSACEYGCKTSVLSHERYICVASCEGIKLTLNE
jgi:hypothetical protein